MKILHTSDLHIGKRINNYPMLEDQTVVLGQIVQIAREEAVDAIILAGDIYDKGVPSAEAVTLFDRFLVQLSRLQKPVFILSGNHDSAERLAFGSRLLEASQIYLSPVYSGKVDPVILPDGKREVAIYMLPFVKPATVAHYADEDAVIGSYDAAVRYAISRMDIDPRRTNILVAHQFVTGAERTESEDQTVGGLDNIDASAFDAFQYVALGHLHRPQCCGRDTIRYSGSPMKYSFSEIRDTKSVTIIETSEEGGVFLRECPVAAPHDWHDLRGTYDELTLRSFYEGTAYPEDYVRITLTDEQDIPNAIGNLSAIYHRLMELRYDNQRTRAGMTNIGTPAKIGTPEELVAELYEKQNGQPMSDEQSAYIHRLIQETFNPQSQN